MRISDEKLAAGGAYVHTTRDLVEGALIIVNYWTKDDGLRVNAVKTELLLFTRIYKAQSFKLPIQDRELSLTFSNQAKYLGVILDKNLS